MTPRKKVGIGFFISGGLFVLAGIVSYAFPDTPTWVPALFGIVGYVASTFGFKIVFPDVEK